MRMLKKSLVCKVSTKSHLLHVSFFMWRKWEATTYSSKFFVGNRVKEKSVDWLCNIWYGCHLSICCWQKLKVPAFIKTSWLRKESCSQLVGQQCHEIQPSSVSTFLYTLVTTTFLSEPFTNKTSFYISTN